MAAFNYGKAAATAERLIARFGQSAVLKTTQNTGTDSHPVITPTSTNCIIAVLGYSDNTVDGTRIQTGDKKVYLSTSGLGSETPSTSADLVIGGVAHKIISVKTLSPAGTVVYYEVQARL